MIRQFKPETYPVDARVCPWKEPAAPFLFGGRPHASCKTQKNHLQTRLWAN